jgi:hypothetical protein
MRWAKYLYIVAIVFLELPLSAQTLLLKGDTQVSRPSLHVELALYLELDTGEAKDLTVRVAPFRAADGRTSRLASVKLNGTAGTEDTEGIWTTTLTLLKQAEPRPTLQVVADFPSRGEYTASVELTFNGTRHAAIPIAVTLTPRPLSVEYIGLNPVEATVGPFRSGSATVKFGVRETTGQQTTIYAPAVTGITRKNGDRIRQAEVKVTPHFETCQSARGANAQSRNETAAKAADEFVIRSRGTCEGAFTLSEIGEAGEYAGKLYVANGDAQPIEVNLPSVFVKESFLTALFFILAGSVASFFIRRYTKESRPKLLALRNVADVRELLEQVRAGSGALGPVEVRVFEGLHRQILTVERDVTRGTSTDQGAAALGQLQTKISLLGDWLNVGRALSQVTPPIIVETPRAQWAALADSVFLTTAKDSTATLKSDLEKIRKDMTSAVKTELLARIDDFDKLTNSFKAAHPGEWDKEISDVLGLLASARTEASADKFPESSAHFQQARLAYFPISIGELKKSLNGPMPMGFEPDTWNTLKRSLQTQVDELEREPDQAAKLSIFQAANRAYVSAIVAALRTRIEELKRGATPSPDVRTSLDKALTALLAAEPAVNRGTWDEALTHYQDAVAHVTAAERALVASGSIESAAAALPAAAFVALPEGAGMGDVEFIPSIQLHPRTRSEQFTQLISARDTRLNIALLGISAVAGLSALWLNDPIWGGWKSYLTAWLAGLGLQQAGGAAIDSVPALTRKLTE